MTSRLRVARLNGPRRYRRPQRLLHLEHLEDRSLLAMISVNTALDENSQTDSTLSLREAIQVGNGTLALSALSASGRAQISGDLNTDATPNTIKFAIPGSGPFTIDVNS